MKLHTIKKVPLRPPRKERSGTSTYVFYGVAVLVFAGLVAFMVNLMTGTVVKRTKEQITTIKLLKPPPPEQKPPEPEPLKEPQKVETVTTAQNVPQPQDSPQDQSNNAPQGSDLGVDAEGGAGGDGFGLVGRKGGRSITTLGGGGMNRLSLMAKYGWYTSKIQDEIKRHVRKKLDADGGIPKGKFQATVKITLDPKGSVVKYQIVASSGDERIDEVLRAALPGFRISQPPPEGMPPGMTVKITSQG